MSHTPAPWNFGFSTVRPIIDLYHLSKDGRSAVTICELQLPLVTGGKSTDPIRAMTQEHNARLIAAAPELLAALETLSEQIVADSDLSEAGRDDPLYLALAKAQAAICRATGGCE